MSLHSRRWALPEAALPRFCKQSVHLERKRRVRLFVERSAAPPAHHAALIDKNQVGGVGRLEAQALFPGIRPAVDRDDVLAILLGSAPPHAAVDEPLAQLGHAADHGNLVERGLWPVGEVSAEPANPRFHGEARIVGEAQRKQGHAASGGVWQNGRPAREELAFQVRHAVAGGKNRNYGSGHQDYRYHTSQMRFSPPWLERLSHGVFVFEKEPYAGQQLEGL